jgi:hypothetical protein
MTDIHPIDNDSTNPALLDCFATTHHTVVFLGRDVGHTSPWLPELGHLRRGPFSSPIAMSCQTLTRQGPWPTSSTC